MSVESIPAHMFNRRRFALMTLLCAGAPGPLWAATPGQPAIPELEGTAADGQRLRLADLKGQVVLVLYWATGCAVCRDKMRELRANLKGWAGQPFTLIGVNMDTQRQDWLDYERLVAQSVPAPQRFVSVWAGGSGFRDSMGLPAQLPSAHLIDKSGQLVEQYRGRVPAQAWNRIADLI
ncbi:MAG: TlpA family protein disulfide reductase [Burkholderiales bacterium]|nr:MAG: TlpA family protein disulfide reductase [Burkholderiales bacterium]